MYIVILKFCHFLRRFEITQKVIPIYIIHFSIYDNITLKEIVYLVNTIAYTYIHCF